VPVHSAHSPVEQPNPTEPLGDILQRIERELMEAAALIEMLEPHLCAAGEGPDAAAERITALQGIDLAVQKIKGLSEFLGQVRAMVPDACLIETTAALNVIKLSDMQKRLAQPDAGYFEPIPKAAAGDIDLF
jgi:hypothetical protein